MNPRNFFAELKRRNVCSHEPAGIALCCLQRTEGPRSDCRRNVLPFEKILRQNLERSNLPQRNLNWFAAGNGGANFKPQPHKGNRMQPRVSLALASLQDKQLDNLRFVKTCPNRVLDLKTLFTAAGLLVLAFQAAVAGDAPVIKVHGYTFTTPLGWTVVARPRGGDVARFTISEGRETAELIFRQYGFGGQSAVDDAESWFNEFSGNAATRHLETERIGSVKITYAITRGTFTPDSSEKKIAPRTGYALCGAILESKSGVAYVKMVGPAEMVSGLTEAFKNMVSDAARPVTTKPRTKPK